MKSLFFLILFFSGSSKAQTLFGTGMVEKLDTIPVLMLCSDTTVLPPQIIDYETDTADHRGGIFVSHLKPVYSKEIVSEQVAQIRGYEIRISNSSFRTINGDRIDIWSHVSYLDDLKKPFKYFVWLSKEIKK